MILTNEIKEILENIVYWDSCPQDYKDKINDYLTSENETKALNIDLVSKRTWKYSYDSDFTTVEFELTFADDEDPYEMAKQIVGTNKADYLNYEVKD